jgi:hypothetical protein
MAAGAEELFIGYTEVHHVANTDGERQFASIVASVTGSEVDVIHEALVEDGLSAPDGRTWPLPETQLALDGSVVSITPIHTPFGERADDPEGVIELIDAELKAERPVGLLSRTGGAYHWTLLTGYYQNDRNGENEPLEKASYHVIDPAHEQAAHSGRHAVLEQIRRSMESMDVYVCAIVPEPEA